MSTHNVPWTESIYFDQLLSQKNLTEEQKEIASQYHRDGYVILKGAIKNDLIDQVLKDLTRDKSLFAYEKPRQGQLWKKMESVKQIALDQKILNILELLYGRKPIPFQTINFKYGSRQKTHSDGIHFNSMPERYMCGVWVALEDIQPDSGPVVYYPGSQTLPMYDYQDISPDFLTAKNDDGSFYKEYYEPFLQQLIEKNNLTPKTLLLEKGDALIWSANILHGGSPVANPNLTRWSQVTHYFFEDCLYFTPLASNRLCGEYELRKITNIATGQKTWGNYNGQQVKRTRISDFRYLITNETGLKKDIFRLAKAVYYKSRSAFYKLKE